MGCTCVRILQLPQARHWDATEVTRAWLKQRFFFVFCFCFFAVDSRLLHALLLIPFTYCTLSLPLGNGVVTYAPLVVINTQEYVKPKMMFHTHLGNNQLFLLLLFISVTNNCSTPLTHTHWVTMAQISVCILQNVMHAFVFPHCDEVFLLNRTVVTAWVQIAYLTLKPATLLRC